MRAALFLAAFADSLSDDASSSGAPGDAGSPWRSARPVGSHVSSTAAPSDPSFRWMWLLAEHLARHGGTVDQGALGRSVAHPQARRRARDEGAPGSAPANAPHSRAWAGGSGTSRNPLNRTGVVATTPVGLIPGVELTVIAHRARRAAAVVDANPEVLDVAAAQAVAVAVAARSAETPIDVSELVTQVATHVRTPGLYAALRRVPPMAVQGGSPQRVAMQLNAYPPAVSALLTALAAFACTLDDPAAAIPFAAAVGEKTGTATALTGALCGAYHGDRALPPQFDVPSRFDRIADSLARLESVA